MAGLGHLVAVTGCFAANIRRFDYHGMEASVLSLFRSKYIHCLLWKVMAGCSLPTTHLGAASAQSSWVQLYSIPAIEREVNA